MRWKSHVRFGGRAGETHRQRCRQGAPVRPLHVEGDVVAVRERPARPAHLCPDREALRSAEVGAEIDRPALLGIQPHRAELPISIHLKSLPNLSAREPAQRWRASHRSEGAQRENRNSRMGRRRRSSGDLLEPAIE